MDCVFSDSSTRRVCVYAAKFPALCFGCHARVRERKLFPKQPSHASLFQKLSMSTPFAYLEETHQANADGHPVPSRPDIAGMRRQCLNVEGNQPLTAPRLSTPPFVNNFCLCRSLRTWRKSGPVRACAPGLSRAPAKA